jgi:hypothetical protein
MVMLEITDNEDEDFAGGRYARTEEELFDKAIALLDKCKIEPLRPDGEPPELEPTARAT